MGLIKELLDQFFPKKDTIEDDSKSRKGYLKKYGFYFLLIIGLFIMIAGNSLFNGVPSAEKKKANVKSEEEYSKTLETRLAQAISQIEGVGSVQVMITLQNSKEVVIAQDNKINEQSIIDGPKTNSTSNRESKSIIVNDQPLILKEIEPKLEGIMIMADGAGNAEVKERIIIAAKTLLGVESHKIAVFQLRKGGKN